MMETYEGEVCSVDRVLGLIHKVLIKQEAAQPDDLPEGVLDSGFHSFALYTLYLWSWQKVPKKGMLVKAEATSEFSMVKKWWEVDEVTPRGKIEVYVKDGMLYFTTNY